MDLELADSYCFNPHKWMFTNFDCDCFFVADRAALIKALSVLPEYLRNKATESGAVIDYRDWQVPLGRRFRALKLWFVIRHYGVEGSATTSGATSRWPRSSPAGSRLHRTLIDRARAAQPGLLRAPRGRRFQPPAAGAPEPKRQALLTHTVLNGRYTLRLCVGQTHTEAAHVRQAWELIQQNARRLAP